MRFAIASVLTVCLLVSPTAFACKCRPPAPPKEALAQSDAVFAGKVTSVEKVGNQIVATIEVSTSWKGVKEKTVNVRTANQSAACGIEFKEGDQYLVYASQQKEGDGNKLSTNLCTRTKTLDAAAEDLKELGEGTKVK